MVICLSYPALDPRLIFFFFSSSSSLNTQFPATTKSFPFPKNKRRSSRSDDQIKFTQVEFTRQKGKEGKREREKEGKEAERSKKRTRDFLNILSFFPPSKKNN
jgi:hypothetical protein